MADSQPKPCVYKDPRLTLMSDELDRLHALLAACDSSKHQEWCMNRIETICAEIMKLSAPPPPPKDPVSN